MARTVWKSIPGWSYYEVSNHGTVRDVDTLQIYRGKNIVLRDKKGQKSFPRAALILLAFTGPSPTKYGRAKSCSISRHLDDVQKNNHIENLAWGSHRDNALDAIRNGKLGPGSEASKKRRAAKIKRKILNKRFKKQKLLKGGPVLWV